MQLPDFLPEEYNFLKEAESDEHLFKLLFTHPVSVTPFLESALDDGMWSKEHQRAIQLILSGLLALFQRGLLQEEPLMQMAKVIRNHFLAVKPLLKQDLTIQLKDGAVVISRLLFAGGSSLFYHRALSVQGKSPLVLDNLTLEQFSPVVEFLCTGSTSYLWKYSQQDIIVIMSQARLWELEALVDQSQETLKRYIDRASVFNMLKFAHEMKYPIIKAACFNFINRMNPRIRFDSTDLSGIRIEILDFKTPTLNLFEKISPLVTSLTCSSQLPADPLFGSLVRQCPNLTGLNISRSVQIGDSLRDIPPDIQELDLSSCPWLRLEHLKEISSRCHAIRRLDLSRNPEIPYSAWSLLKQLRGLEVLDISKCLQVTDQEFKLILLSCRSLSALKVGECSRISEKSFSDIATALPLLTHLDVSKTSFANTPLVEVAARCQELQILNVSGCDRITQRGIEECLKLAEKLQEIYLEDIAISEGLIEVMRQRGIKFHL